MTLVSIYRNISFSKVFLYLLWAIAFFIPLLPKLLPIIIILWIACWLILIVIKKIPFVFNKKLLFIIPVYLIYLIGLTYTENLTHGIKDLETKLSLLVIPIVFSTIKLRFFERHRTKLYFIAGCFVAMTFNLLQSAYAFYIHYTLNIEYNFHYFLYSSASPVIHTAYLSLYFCLAICFIIEFLRSTSLKFNPFILYFALIGLTIFVLMLSSRAGILTLLMILIFYGFVFAMSVLNIKKFLVPGFLIIISIGTFLFFVPEATSRIDFDPSILSGDTQIKSDTENSTELRILIWKSAFDILKANPLFGVGTGDVKQALLNEYHKKNIIWATHFQLNAHNQFLQTWLAVGVLGLFALLIWIFLLIRIGIISKDPVQVIFGIILILNFMFESMLETQAGVIFIAFFVSFLLFNSDRKIEKASPRL